MNCPNASPDSALYVLYMYGAVPLVLSMGLAVKGCTLPGRAGTLDHNRFEAVTTVTPVVDVQADLTAALAKIDTLEAIGVRVDSVEAALAKIDTRIGQIAVGGGGDSVTAWLYALIALVAVASALFYPLAWRPAARRMGLRANVDETSQRRNVETMKRRKRETGLDRCSEVRA